jgi:hypothetical protein
MAHKYLRDWRAAREAALRAIELEPDPPDFAAYGVLGIAATALGEEGDARWAWRRCGHSIDDEGTRARDDGRLVAVRVPSLPDHPVWCIRKDPARGQVVGVPRPGSAHVHGDMLLLDDEERGTRVRRGVAHPLFDELATLALSRMCTWALEAMIPSRVDLDELRSRCLEDGIPTEDWTAASRAAEWETQRIVGVAAKDPRSLAAISGWATARDGRRVLRLEFVPRVPAPVVSGE